MGKYDQNPKVTLIGHRAVEGHLTGRKKPGRRCEYWQVYKTKVPRGDANNIGEWWPSDQILVIGNSDN
jgi:hypothetical protein